VNIEKSTSARKKLTSVQGGLLVHEEDTFSLDESTMSIPTKRKHSEHEWKDLKRAWKHVKTGKSNAIDLAKD
ncbi:bifunctional phosphoribosylaminoimidazolecarboxamide formyltransferase/IMP cyclohydrolase, partial [Bacillus cereus]|nr:bifunctional phosphoribosylaminoimidazolecarboxamide formyltransferase/IMP cyclohydrolase [Bacillus cereus]